MLQDGFFAQGRISSYLKVAAAAMKKLPGEIPRFFENPFHVQ